MMKKVMTGFVVICALVVVGCAPRNTSQYEKPQTAVPSTPYKERGAPRLFGIGEYPFGYYEDELSSASYMISVETNFATPAAQIRDMALLRAADLGRQKGFDKFRVSYETVVSICNDNVHVPRNAARLLVQYGRGDQAIGPDDEALKRAMDRASRGEGFGPFTQNGRGYRVAEILSLLEQKVKNFDAFPTSAEERIAANKSSRAQCLEHIF